MEVIDIQNIGLASYNPKVKVSSEMLENNHFIPSEYLKTKKYVEEVNNWSENNKMVLNPKKTKKHDFQFQFQFTG